MTVNRQSMPLATLCMLFVIVGSLGFASSTADANPRIGQSLREALIDLNEQGTNILFSSESVENWMRVDVSPTSNDPLTIARQILATHGLGLAEGPGGRWIVKRTQKKRDPSLVTISGRVVDADSNLEIIGAVITSSTQTVEANRVGRFSIDVRLPVNLAVSADGYEPVRYSIATDQSVQIPLKPEAPRLEELTVVASRYLLFSGDAKAQFSHDEIDQLPHLADDTARIIGWVPAITSNDFSARFNVRGGWYDEVTMRLDGLDLVDPFHIKDLHGSFSIIDSNLVDGVAVMPGGYSTLYGNSASGFVDIVSLPPPKEPVHSVGLSFTNAFVNSRGSFNSDAGGWLISARRGYLDWVFNQLESGNGKFRPRYYDIFGKIEHSVGDRHNVAVQVLTARDDFFYLDEEDVIRVDGKANIELLWTRVETHWSKRLASEFVLWRNSVDRIRDNYIDNPSDISATLLDLRENKEWGLRSDWGWRINEQWQLDFGAELRDYRTEYDYSLVSQTNSPVFPGHPPIDRQIRLQVEGRSSSVYAAVRRDFGQLTAELGWRWDAERYTGRNEILQSPRLGLKYELSERTRLTASWGRYAQFQRPEELQVEDGIEQFFPATRSEHLIVGIEHQLNDKTSFRAEAYRKSYQYVRPRFTNLFSEFKPIPEAKADRVLVTATSANASGLELTFKHKSGAFSLRGSYVLSKVTDRVGEVNVPRDWDQRQAVDLTLNWEGARWNFNLASRWHTGWPRTDATTGIVDTPSGPVPIFVPGERNAGQNSNYFRVDTRISRDVEWKRGEFTYFFEIYNLFDTENTCCIEGYDLAPGPQLNPNYGHWLPRLPSLGFSLTF